MHDSCFHRIFVLSVLGLMGVFLVEHLRDLDGRDASGNDHQKQDQKGHENGILFKNARYVFRGVFRSLWSFDLVTMGVPSQEMRRG